MSGRLRRRYERLLFTYPPAYRMAHGEEMLSTLLEAARPDQRFPALRESASLLLGGLRTRAQQAARQSPRRLWADGLQLGVLLIVLVNLGHALQMRWPLWIALVAVGALAVLRGWTRTALIATTVDRPGGGAAAPAPGGPAVVAARVRRLVGGSPLCRPGGGPGLPRLAQGRQPAGVVLVVVAVARGRGAPA